MPRRARAPRDTRKPAPTSAMILSGEHIIFKPEGGGHFVGTVEEINALLTAMGYHEITVRINLMSRTKYIEAKLTPIYLSPASETYWSM